MLKKYNQVFITFLFILDLCVISLAWFLAYFLRFDSGFIEATKGIPTWGQHLPLLVILLLVCGVVFHVTGLYRAKRLKSLPNEVFDLIKATTVSVLIFVSLTYFFKEYRYSRLTILYFWLLTILFTGLLRSLARQFLKSLRRKGFNLRHVLVVGEGDLGQKLIRSFQDHPELGLKAIGFLSDSREKVGQMVGGVKVLGTHEELHQVLKRGGIDQVFIALPFHLHERITDILASLKNELVTIKVVSDLYDFVTLRGGVDELDGLPIINIQDAPLPGWGKIAQRALDKVTVNSIVSSKKKYLSVLILSTGILSAILLRVTFLSIETADYRVFLSGWYDFIKTHGGIRALGYPFSDYTPPYLYLLVLATYLPFQKIVAIKLISILFDFICAGFVFFIVRLKHKDPLTLVSSFLAVLFFPTVFANSAYWGQCDAVYTAGLLGSLYFLLKKKPVFSLFLFSIAFSVKQQSLFFFPVLLVLLLRKTLQLKHFVIIPITYVLLMVPSYLLGRPMEELLLVYFNQATQYKLLTGIPNIYIFLPPSHRLEAYGVFSIFITLIAVGILSFFIVKKRIPVTGEMIIKLSFVSLLIVPYFLPRMHERYYFPADLFSVVYGFCFKQYFYIPFVMAFISYFSYCPFLFGKESIDFRILALLATMVLIVALTDFKKLGAGGDA